MSEEHVSAALDATYDRRPPFEARLAARAKRLTKRRAQSILWLLIASVGFLTRTTRRRATLPELRAGNPQIRRILLVRLDLIGDVILSLPAARALRRAYPDAAIDMLVQPSAAPVLAAERDAIDHVLTCNPYRWLNPVVLLRPSTWREVAAVIRTLRAGHYDLAISVSGDMNSIFTRLSGAHQRIGYAGEAYPFLLTDLVPGARYRRHQHEVRYVLALAEAAGATIQPADDQLQLHILPDAARRAADLLHRARATTSVHGPIIAIHVGARNGQAKRWPPAHIAALSDRLIGELGALVLLTGAPNEAPLAQVVLHASTRGKLVNLTGKTTIPELIALIAASDVVVSGDSGPMHIACAVGTPVVALHGPTDPGLSGPTAPDAIVLRRALWCSPCYDASATAECRFGNPICMKSLAPSLVFAAVRRQLHRRDAHDPTIQEGARDATSVSLASQS